MTMNQIPYSCSCWGRRTRLSCTRLRSAAAFQTMHVLDKSLSFRVFSNTNRLNAAYSSSPAGSSNPRAKFEEEYHLQSGLSNIHISSKQSSIWKQIIDNEKKKKHKNQWLVPPIEIFPSPKYEIEALQTIHQRSHDCNVLLEIRDVRLPSSCHHPSFTRLAKHRLHLIAYTHADLIDTKTRNRVEEWTKRSWPDARPIFVDTRDSRPLTSKNTSNPESPFEMVYNSLMKYLDEAGGVNAALTVGVANTGKSSLLQCLVRHAKLKGFITKKTQQSKLIIKTKNKRNKVKRILRAKGNPAIEDKPGKTRELIEYLLRESPRAFFLDVPGMTPPSFYFVERPEAWFGMAAANLIVLSKGIQEDPIHQTTICDYVLHCLNRDSNFVYVSKLQLAQPSTDIDIVLNHMGGSKITNPEARRLRQCQNFLKFLNTGNLGPVILDDISKPYQPFHFKDSHFQQERNPLWDDREI